MGGRKQIATFAFRADAALTPEIGTGHVVRCVVIARGIRSRRPSARLVFFTRDTLPDTTLLEEFAESAVMLSSAAADDELIEHLGGLGSAGPRTLVWDTLGTRPRTVSRARALGWRVVAIDDAGDGALVADVSINPIFHRSDATFFGYEYLVLPHPPRIGPPRIRSASEDPTIFLGFGGHDEHALLPRTLAALVENRERKWSIDASASYPQAVYERAIAVAGDDPRVRVRRRPRDHFDRLASADIAIVAGGLTLFSALHFGVPTVAIAQYPHQLINAERCEAVGAAISLGLANGFDASRLRSVVCGLLDDAARRKVLSDNGRRLVDGRGSERVLDVLCPVTRE